MNYCLLQISYDFNVVVAKIDCQTIKSSALSLLYYGMYYLLACTYMYYHHTHM